MKIAVTATGTTLDSPLDARFGRCSYFVLVETDTKQFTVIQNENGSLGGGAGIQSAQRMAQEKVEAVLTGNCGPNAHATLVAAGIQVFIGCSGTVASVVEQLRLGLLHPASAPNVATHAGMGNHG
jgi:predicted Fe-Mo cluster-binding NifX family protein